MDLVLGRRTYFTNFGGGIFDHIHTLTCHLVLNNNLILNHVFWSTYGAKWHEIRDRQVQLIVFVSIFL